jgi:cytochrome c-type protein NapB
MKTIPFLATLGLICALTGTASAEAIDELNMGLSKTSVFDTPTPSAYAYSDAEPGKNDWLPRAWDGIPPQIPHSIAEFLPVVAEDNQCLDCHDKPRYIGLPKNTDRSVKNKSPMSRAHYTSDELDQVDGARFNCTQCHVPQTNAAPLVGNTYQ